MKSRQAKDVTYRISAITQNTILNNQDQSNSVWSITKVRQDNDMINCIDLLYIENKIELSRPIRQGTVHGKNKQDNGVTDRTGVIYAENKAEL